MFQPEFKECPLCGSRLVKNYNTNEKTITTLNGKLVCWERVLKCRNKGCKGNSMSFHSADYKGLALPSMNFGIDVVAHEGGLRFEEHKTILELLGIETPDFITMSQKVSIQTYKNEKLKQIELLEPYRVRLRVNQIGIRKFVDHLVQEFDNETYILKGGDC